MKLPDLKKADLKNKRVLVRVDFNVEFSEGGGIKEKYRIETAKKTIDFILSKKGTRLALLSHLGRPEGREEKFSLEKIYKDTGRILGMNLIFVPECFGGEVKKALDNLKPGEALMLENIRFFSEESENDKNFAGKIAENFDAYVNEAFGASHRLHSSVAAITDFLPSYAGFNLQKETDELGAAREKFNRPAVAIIGGAKIETKLPVISFLEKKYDWVLVGGRLGIEAEKQKIIFGANVILAEDYLKDGLDIGPKTIEKFKEKIKDAKTIIWNGPLGKFEDPNFAFGTEQILEAVWQNKEAKKIAGGGETVQVLEEHGVLENFDFVSTGGGAMLEFLAKGDLPALEELRDNY
ncbi:MAG: phosphoglycerate kinase [Candidatus Pacebacteria bacterium]|nr:phosphoglycerate kinase [Candidatus Paceibacterota bacterium]